MDQYYLFADDKKCFKQEKKWKSRVIDYMMTLRKFANGCAVMICREMYVKLVVLYLTQGIKRFLMYT